jgi:hypothetical protein
MSGKLPHGGFGALSRRLRRAAGLLGAAAGVLARADGTGGAGGAGLRTGSRCGALARWRLRRPISRARPRSD